MNGQALLNFKQIKDLLILTACAVHIYQRLGWCVLVLHLNYINIQFIVTLKIWLPVTSQKLACSRIFLDEVLKDQAIVSLKLCTSGFLNCKN